MSGKLNWSSGGFVGRLLREVLGTLDRSCLCPEVLTIGTFSGRGSWSQEVRCARPSGHSRPHRTSDGRTGPLVAQITRDPVAEAADTMRRAERAVRRSKRSERSKG